MAAGGTVVVGLEERALVGEDEGDVNMKEQVYKQLNRFIARRRVYF